MSAVERCRHCGATIQQGDEKALDGTYAVVWANDDGEWVCPVTGDEHEPGGMMLNFVRRNNPDSEEPSRVTYIAVVPREGISLADLTDELRRTPTTPVNARFSGGHVTFERDETPEETASRVAANREREESYVERRRMYERLKEEFG